LYHPNVGISIEIDKHAFAVCADVNYANRFATASTSKGSGA
jgi:hypothetical protein